MKNNKNLNLLLMLLSFFVFVFFTTNVYSNLQETIDLKNTKEKKLENLNKKLKILNDTKNNLNSKNKLVNKFTKEFNEAEIFKYINDYIEQANKQAGEVVIEFGSISFSEPKKSELGFKEININLKLKKVQDLNSLFGILNYLVNTKNKYSFFITNFSFSIEKYGPYSGINIPLKMYIK